LLCPTERELRLALHDFDRGLSNVAWNAMDATRARHMLVTLGKKGLVVFDRESQDRDAPQWRSRLRSEYLPSLVEHVVDPLGGGDAVLATATLVLASGGSLMQAAYLGTAAAAIEMTQLGNVPVDLGLLRRWLAGRVELTGARYDRQGRPSSANGLDVTSEERRIGTKRCRIPLVAPAGGNRGGATLPPREAALRTRPPQMPTPHADHE
jgi:bifunctional ADP-heptose synthase (sugar kinase/adenylyltransferase)